ncbi:MAG: hypothetical protein J5802_12085 [Butyrivibrio sp.]|nr:hypothetical protein [Butyrivibrio sp.]
MKGLKVLLAAGMVASLLIGCTSVEEAINVEVDGDSNAEATVAEETGAEETAEESAETGDVSNAALTVPVVKDGVTVQGSDCVDVFFDWDAVEGADGYEVSSEMKFSEESEYKESDTGVEEVTEPGYSCGAQDDFDFRIKVRSFKGEGSNKEYSDWSEPASGTTKRDLNEKWDSSYDEFIKTVSDGLKNGFTDEQKGKLDISDVFYNAGEDMGFAYYTKDIDGDGTAELILTGYVKGVIDADQGIIYDMYTMQNGKMVQVFNAGERDKYFLCYNNMIAKDASAGADFASYAYYKYANGKLEIVESVFQAEKAGSDQAVYYRSNKEPGEDKSNEITSEEAENIRNLSKYRCQSFCGSDLN